MTPFPEPHEEFEPTELGYYLPDGDKPKVQELLDVEELDMGYDKYVGSKVMLPRDGFGFTEGKVIKRSRDINGELIGRSDVNPINDFASYGLSFQMGSG